VKRGEMKGDGRRSQMAAVKGDGMKGEGRRSEGQEWRVGLKGEERRDERRRAAEFNGGSEGRRGEG
jgi:hypothetical protein